MPFLVSVRITFVDQLTIRLIGDVIPHGPDRPGYPFMSSYEQRRKRKTNQFGYDWAQLFVEKGLTKEKADDEAAAAAKAVKDQEEIVFLPRKDRVDAEEAQHAASQEVSSRAKQRGAKHWREQAQHEQLDRQAYDRLREKRTVVRGIAKEVEPEEEKLRALKRTEYQCNQLTRVTKTLLEATSSQAKPNRTNPTWDKLPTEESVKFLDITGLVGHQGEDRMIAFSGTDYGLVTMSETVPLTLGRAHGHFTGFQESVGPSMSQRDVLDIIKIPQSFTITARQLQDVTFTRRLLKTRQALMEKNNDVKVSLSRLSTIGKFVQRTTNPQDLNASQVVRRECREPLRGFESSQVLTKMRHTQRLRTTRGIRALAGAERRFIVQHDNSYTYKDGTSSVSPIDGFCDLCQCFHVSNSPESTFFTHPGFRFNQLPKVAPIMLIGDAGTCVGSRLSGHLRRGGGRMRHEHARYSVVALQDEYMTSQTCVFCFSRTRLARAFRDGKLVNVRGAVVCQNPDCISNRMGYTTKPRDNHAALAIALAGAHILLDPSRRALPCFSRG